MQTGDIIFYKAGKGIIPKIISFLSKSEYSHVAIALDSTRILEADRFIKSRIVELQYDTEIHRVYRIEGLTEEQKTTIRTLIKAFEGYPYDYLEIIRWFVLLAFKYDVPLINRANYLFCAEVVDYVLHHSLIPRKDTYPVGRILPHMLIEVYDAKRIV